jgi:hypothetical protein
MLQNINITDLHSRPKGIEHKVTKIPNGEKTEKNYESERYNELCN